MKHTYPWTLRRATSRLLIFWLNSPRRTVPSYYRLSKIWNYSGVCICWHQILQWKQWGKNLQTNIIKNFSLWLLRSIAWMIVHGKKDNTYNKKTSQKKKRDYYHQGRRWCGCQDNVLWYQLKNTINYYKSAFLARFWKYSWIWHLLLEITTLLTGASLVRVPWVPWHPLI